MSPLRSSAGPAVWTNGTPSSSATIRARLVLPRPGGPASSTWSSASPRAAAAAIETPSCSLERLLADELVEPARAQRRVELVLGALVRRLERGRRRACGCSPARPLQRVGDQVLGRLAGRAVEQLARPPRREAEPDEPVAGEQPRVVAAGDDDRVVGRRGADLLAQLDDDPLRRALADPRARPAAAPCRRRRRRRAARAACRRRAPRAPPSARRDWTPISSRNRSRSASDDEAVERQRVVAHDQVGVQRRRLADRGRVAQRLGRDREPVADAAAATRPRGRSAARRPRR